MPLPKIDMPIYELSLPSNDKKVKYRPFTVKEEKILLIAQESKDTEQIISSIKQIVNNCLLEDTIDSLSLVDLEYLLISIRSKSVDNIVKFKIEDPDTEESIELELDLTQVKIEKPENHTNQIEVSEDYVLFLKYPTAEDFFVLLNEDKSETERNYDIMLCCLDKLASEEDVFNFKDFSKKEVDDFIESLHNDVVKKMKEFFDTIPKVRHEVEYINKNGDNKTFVIQGTQTFFI